MKFTYDIVSLNRIIEGKIFGNTENKTLHAIHFDTRLFDDGTLSLFLCLNGKRSGSSFIPEAYRKGCRAFLVDEQLDSIKFPEATFILVDHVLLAIQKLAVEHRKQFDIPVIGITGSFGKTIIKEWLYHCLKDRYNIVRSPKSYNSQLGVALSVLQMTTENTLGIFEAGISKTNEMVYLEPIIHPTIGLFTGLGSAHDDGFQNRDEKLFEKSKLFSSCTKVISEHFLFQKSENVHWCKIQRHSDHQSTHLHVPNYVQIHAPFSEQHKVNNLCAVLATLKSLNFPPNEIQEKVDALPQLAMRMESIQGKRGNVFLNDSYALDGIPEAIASLSELSNNKSAWAYIALNTWDSQQFIDLQNLRVQYKNIHFRFVSQIVQHQEIISFEDAENEIQCLQNAAILLKGQHGSGIAKLLAPQILRSHPTVLEISKQALRNNLTQFKKQIQTNTQLMVMVKAAAYGIGAYEMASFLEREGIDYLGVAFPDEGVNLRKLGVRLPILVMNTHEASFHDVITFDLEPAIFSLQQLDKFTTELVRSGKSKYPIHLKIETGMNRLGFRPEDLGELTQYLISQPEIQVKSVYSHLAESGNTDQSFTRSQLQKFEHAVQHLKKNLNYRFFKHICNTDGIINYPEAHFDMVRLGIGLLGYAKLPGLEHAVAMKTRISKINEIQNGESLGYDRSYTATEDKKIAVLPIGYADGFRRIFGNGLGHVIIDGRACKILGNVCMDMCFADVTELNNLQNTEVELLGPHVTINEWALWAKTIPYEIITALSPRINRIWVE